MCAVVYTQVLTTVLEKGGEELQLRAMDILLSSVQHDSRPPRDFLLAQQDHALLSLLVRWAASLLVLLQAAREMFVYTQCTVVADRAGKGPHCIVLMLIVTQMIAVYACDQCEVACQMISTAVAESFGCTAPHALLCCLT